MIRSLMLAGQRLAEALQAENEALAALDLGSAAVLATVKVQACEAFAAAQAAVTAGAARSGNDAALLSAEERQAAERLARRLETLGAENRRLLERAIALQSRVIEAIAGAAIPRAAGPERYQAGGTPRRPPPGRTVPPLALSARA
ncbi:hypothetical protein [Caldovatus aquaticus]|uniref:Flagellar protein FlgN n=1 Tax=Caldovatus aquaticus TaxID=2865671 RepID=A0ABS7EZS9_9PROT|nr:hypothetical protein [Caldovatus aquaticus]MBW8268876.1 hypothetical protein [Caldovatus aquaticus]